MRSVCGNCAFVFILTAFTWELRGATSEDKDEDHSYHVHFPAESDRHERTFMTWPQYAVWQDDLDAVRTDIAAIAHAIVQFEPVTLIVSPKEYQSARDILDKQIRIMRIPVDDLWARDTLPVFTFLMMKSKTEGSMLELLGIDFNFNGWGKKQKTRAADSAVARKLLSSLKVKRRQAEIVTEGGSLETDGAGTLLVTKSSIINPNRNPGKTKEEIDDELRETLGVKKIIWFKGVAGKDITDAHVDSIVRFVRPGRVIVSRPHPKHNSEDEDVDVWTKSGDEALEVLKAETDARGKKFEIVELFEPDRNKFNIVGDEDSFVSTYVNFYVINGAVIMPKFGDEEADELARKTLEKEFSGRKIIAVNISAVAGGGGGIHCATHELPYLRSSGNGNSVGIISRILTTLVLLMHFS